MRPRTTTPVADQFPNDNFPSTYKPLPSKPTLIRNATVLTATDKEIAHGDVLMQNGKIVAVGTHLTAPAGGVVVDGTGKFVTPGIIDIHSHLGVYPSPSNEATSDGNEATRPTTPDVRSENSVWPEDPGFTRALAGGVTAMQILPGSANLIGGRSVVLKNVPAITTQAIEIPRRGPMTWKMACGENPQARLWREGRPADVDGQRRRLSRGVQGARVHRAEIRLAEDYLEGWKKAGKDADAPDARSRHGDAGAGAG